MASLYDIAAPIHCRSIATQNSADGVNIVHRTRRSGMRWINDPSLQDSEGMIFNGGVQIYSMDYLVLR